jgi:hypothetical protein
MRIVLSVYSSRAADAPKDDTARAQFCTYVRNAIAASPMINDVVIWNEPNLNTFWRPQFNADGSSAAPAAYEALLGRCWEILHTFRSSINVIGPGTSPRGNDDPQAVSSISHSPVSFIQKMGEAYVASGRTKPIFDTVGQNVYGDNAWQRPWRKHPLARAISEGDWDKLLATYDAAFSGTGQPPPGHCIAYRCVPIWYLEAGYWTTVDHAKAWAYVGAPIVPGVPDYVGGEPASPAPSPESPAPDQWTQIIDGVRLAYCQPYVGAFFNFMMWDDPVLRGWRTGPFWADRTAKDSYPAFAQVIGEVNSHSVDCRALKGGPIPSPDTTPPAAPAGLTATSLAGGEGAVLEWGDSLENDVAGFDVYRRTSARGPYTRVNATLLPASRLTDRVPNGASTYVVRAVDTMGNESEPSAEARVGRPSTNRGSAAPGRLHAQSEPDFHSSRGLLAESSSSVLRGHVALRERRRRAHRYRFVPRGHSYRRLPRLHRHLQKPGDRLEAHGQQRRRK